MWKSDFKNSFNKEIINDIITFMLLTEHFNCHLF